MRQLPPLIAPFRFAAVEHGLYRGAYPSLRSFRFLRRLRLRTIVSLIPDQEPSRDLQEFCAQERIRSIHFNVAKYDDGVTISAAQAAAVLSELINADNLPLYVHCRDGGNNTGLVVMCLRRLQYWALEPLFDEFCRYVKTGEISREESSFVESLRAEILVPPNIPTWLWQGVHIVSHPAARLRVAAPTASEVASKLSSESSTKIALDQSTQADASRRKQDGGSLSNALPRPAAPASGPPDNNVGAPAGSGEVVPELMSNAGIRSPEHEANKEKKERIAAPEDPNGAARDDSQKNESLFDRDRKWAESMHAFDALTSESVRQTGRVTAVPTGRISNQMAALLPVDYVQEYGDGEYEPRVSRSLSGLNLEGISPNSHVGRRVVSRR